MFVYQSKRAFNSGRGLLVALVIASSLVGCGGDDEDASEPGAMAGQSGTPEAGSSAGNAGGVAAYKSTCGSCHGADGQGVPSLGPELQHPVRDYFTWVIRNGRTPGEHADFASSAMTAYGAAVISDAQLAEVFDYLDSFDKPTDGQGLYLDYCGTCHGAAGEGPAPLNRNIASLDGAAFIDNVRGGHHPGEFDNRREFMPKWSADELTDAELQLMADYIATL